MSSHTMLGLGVSAGIAIGETIVHVTRPESVRRMPVSEEKLEDECRRFRAAVRSTVSSIRRHQERALSQIGEDYATIFEAHQMIATDSSLIEPVERIIREQYVNAEFALDQVVSTLIRKFDDLGDLYLSERKLDLLDVSSQILRTLQGQDLPDLSKLDRPTILVADDLPPSQAVQLPMDKILGFALESGGPTSHTTIIARSFGIPTIVGVHGACEAARHASSVILDAFEGQILFDPNGAEVAEYRSRQQQHEEQRTQLFHMRTLPTVTRDGVKVQLLANIDLPVELEQALDWNVDGVGLYRSEFLYLKMSPALPGENDHLELYRDLMRRMGDLPVTVRTFDLGGKKLAREVIGSPEDNPVLGLRGIRLCLAKPDFFRVQLRALLRAAGEYAGRLQIMLPLISGIEEIRITKVLIRELMDELERSGLRVPESVALGAMIEVPSSAVMAQELAREVDFMSIGTNDLIQYTLAVDRTNDLVADRYKPTHPAILRLINDVIRAGQHSGVPVSMCGEMAADPLMVPVLLGMGLRKFSMTPQAIPVIRNLVRQLTQRETSQMAKEALKMVMARDVEEYLLERLALSLAKIKIHV